MPLNNIPQLIMPSMCKNKKNVSCICLDISKQTLTLSRNEYHFSIIPTVDHAEISIISVALQKQMQAYEVVLHQDLAFLSVHQGLC